MKAVSRNTFDFLTAVMLGFFVAGVTALGAQSQAPYHGFDKSESAAESWGHSKSTRTINLVPAHATANTSPLTAIRILPSSLSLSIPLLSQRVVVEATYADGHVADVTAQARITSSASAVARPDAEGFIHPEGNGQAVLAASFKSFRATVPVSVENFTSPFVWSFRNHVLPVMTKMGCNSGPCHGAAAGKNGFKLTLRGFDPVTDYYTLTHQAIGRRTNRLEPARSLILLKPTLTIAHGGGQRFPVGSPEYQVISGWIAAGMPPPKASDPRIVDLQVYPHEASLVPGAMQQLIVMARFSDGHYEDVTRWAKYDSGDEGVATVTDSGLVTMHSYGEAPVTVWYLSHVTFARMRIPYPYGIDEAVFQRAPRHNYIDDYILAHLQQLHIPPSPPATDSEFIRRAYLDAAGILP
ncbi:MAG TPA: Ig-like domain-containing protein, partial [Terriglobia bacterium]|nr:Ig-like domain-containing protein [Terriglobia bacterium]